MTTRHSRLSYTTLQFLYLLMHSTSLGNIHTVAVFFFSYIESNTLLMSERQSDWEVGGGKKKKISLPSIICDFTKKKTKSRAEWVFHLGTGAGVRGCREAATNKVNLWLNSEKVSQVSV